MASKSYDKQFKITAVKLVLEDEAPVAYAARKLSINDKEANTKNTERVRSRQGNRTLSLSKKSSHGPMS